MKTSNVIGGAAGLWLAASFTTPLYASVPEQYASAPQVKEESRVIEPNGQERPADDKGVFSIVWENDIFAGEDQNYTNGFRASWMSSESHVPDWVKWSARNLLPVSNEGNKRISVAVGQSMFTPEDLSRRDVIQDDRPYAGWLYGSVGVVSDTGTQLDNVMLTVGVVGPLSGAEDTQKFVHKVIDSPHPNGWNNQLDNEPGIMLTWDRAWRGLYEFSPFGLGVDATPHVGVDVANVITDAAMGMTFRLGFDLPADYGPPRIRPSLPGSDFFIPTQELSGYLFAGFEGRAVGHNIFLDGNTFSDSHDVDKEILVGGLQAGAALTYGDARLSYTHVFMTREFHEQDRPAQFGVVTLSYRF